MKSPLLDSPGSAHRSWRSCKWPGAIARLVCLTLLAVVADHGASAKAQVRDEKTLPRPTAPARDQVPRKDDPSATRVEEPLPPGFEAGVKRDYEKIKNPELTLPRYLELRKQRYQDQKTLEKHPERQFAIGLHNVKSASATMTGCGNGDFDTRIDPNQWLGANGRVAGGQVNSTTLFTNYGIQSGTGAITDFDAHQTLVSLGAFDATLGGNTLPVTPGTPHAVRIGNSAKGPYGQALAKLFVVTPANAQMTFAYAVVLQDPLAWEMFHSLGEKPYFWVRVRYLDDDPFWHLPILKTLHHAVDFGGNTFDKITADVSNPFFQVKHAGETYLYKNWSCAKIDLSSIVGKTVFVEFITANCSMGEHLGYAYIANLCGSNCVDTYAGNIGFNPETSATCGPSGKLCFNYSVPKNPTSGATGSVNISLACFQNGTQVGTLTSGPLTTGTSYCFDILPSGISWLNKGLPGFDYVATASFALGSFVPVPKTIGTAPEGRIAGQNNDWLFACHPKKTCCDGKNLIVNGDFEAAPIGQSKPPIWPGIISQYAASTSIGPGSVLPGQYDIVTGAQALQICPNWQVADHFTCDANAGKFMVVNGRTSQASGNVSIWKQTVAVTPGKEYRFCANVKCLPQCGPFNISPVIHVKFSGTGISSSDNIGPTTVNPTFGPCHWQLVTGNVHVPAACSSLTIDLLLNEQGQGDGNDLAIDDISLQEKTLVPANYVTCNVTTSVPDSAGKYAVRADYPQNLPRPEDSQHCGYVWGVCELDSSGNCKPANNVSNPSAWWTYPNPTFNQFNTYNGLNSTLNGPSPGVFYANKNYRITFAVWCECQSLVINSWDLRYNRSLNKVEVVQAPKGHDVKLTIPLLPPHAPGSDYRPLPKSPAANPLGQRPESVVPPTVPKEVPGKTAPETSKGNPARPEVKPMPKDNTISPKKEPVDPKKDKDAPTPPKDVKPMPKDATSPPRKEPSDPRKDKGEGI